MSEVLLLEPICPGGIHTFFFFCGLFNNTVSISDSMVSGGRKTDELLRIWKEAMMTYSRYYHGIIEIKFSDGLGRH
jgi:hypothetical protein